MSLVTVFKQKLLCGFYASPTAFSHKLHSNLASTAKNKDIDKQKAK